jgi:hypothetical protein
MARVRTLAGRTSASPRCRAAAQGSPLAYSRLVALFADAVFAPLAGAGSPGLTIARPEPILLSLDDFETIAQEVSALGQRVSDLEARLKHVEKVNTGLEEAALTTARSLQEISAHWDKVYEAIRRVDITDHPK